MLLYRARPLGSLPGKGLPTRHSLEIRSTEMPRAGGMLWLTGLWLLPLQPAALYVVDVGSKGLECSPLLLRWLAAAGVRVCSKYRFHLLQIGTKNKVPTWKDRDYEAPLTQPTGWNSEIGHPRMNECSPELENGYYSIRHSIPPPLLLVCMKTEQSDSQPRKCPNLLATWDLGLERTLTSHCLIS